MHVLGMPPAFVLSQDQTLKFVSLTNQARGKPANPTGKSFKEPIPALSNVMDTNEHASSLTTCGGNEDVAIGLVTGIRSLKTPGPGAVAHMSLHQKPTMSKNHQTLIADS